ncbi:uncharacterized protein LOC125563069 [Nematostella vectensis]|uniref:uncharacterized protein LOC125563069 n=1 Tax=Nematostella vectensis TaxID=45351 RepID=UPI0020776E8E|nr:uncharacterized protein LOC125563069 [Nematostella vectensis]
MAYPCRYSDLIHRFHRSVPELSMISNTVLDTVYYLHHLRLTTWNDQLLSPVQLQQYAEAIYNKGSPLNNCFGFVDGTVPPICRPGVHQRIVYNGHKRVHAIKFQSVVVPNGMVANMYGPVEGRKHDSGMLKDSGLLQSLQQHAFGPTGQPMALYGDPAYPLRVHLQVPFRNGTGGLTPDMEAFNEGMSAVRSSVEWLFGDILKSFKFLDFKKNLKISLSSVGKMYLVSAIFDFFYCDPPTLQQYLIT